MLAAQTLRRLNDTMAGVERAASAITISSRNDMIPIRDATLETLSEVKRAAQSANVAFVALAIVAVCGLLLGTVVVLRGIEP